MTLKAFVAGQPISHSKSPNIHQYWLKQFNIDGEYQAIELAPNDLAQFMADIKNRKKPFAGGNFTIPHKEQAFHLADHVDDIARKVKAVNTIHYHDGQIYGTNTDAYGFSANLDDFSKTWRNGNIATIVGAGGACRAILHALIKAKYSEIRLYNRTLERAQALKAEFGPAILAFPIEQLQIGLQDSDLFVNTSSLGMHGSEVPQLNFDMMSDRALVTDIVYAPLITPFLNMAQTQYRPIADGFGMLLHQAVPGFELWFGQRPAVTPQLRTFILEGV